ncbi:Putative acyl-CoA dehydrogenase AidB [Geobacillus sp. 12AMOR1]|nr:Putative acyl-CoA dehydrogenase AidB [Geobacillus sp. 12AMOR1]
MHYFTISDLAQEFDVSTRTIRYYEERGLLSPIRTESGQRLYTKKERAKLKLILRGKRFGFSLDEIHEMIALFDEDRTGKKQLEKTVEYGRRKLKEVSERIEDLLQLKAEMEALNLSRVCNAVASVGIMKRALEEAKQYAERRTAFGHVLTNYPMVRGTLANLTARQEVETSACFDMIALFDRVMAAPHEASEAEKAWLRLLIALLKMRTAEEAIAFSHEAIELHGGNGYIEDFVTPRLLRDAQVLTVWEGTANILALEVLRLMRKYRIHERFAAEMQERLERLTAEVKPLARPVEEGLKELVAALARLGGQADEVQTFHAKAIANRMCDLYLSIIALERGQEDERNRLIAELFLRHVWERGLVDERMTSVREFDLIVRCKGASAPLAHS